MSKIALSQAIIEAVAFAFVLLLPTTVEPASFDCSKASNQTETLICSSEQLSQLDDELSDAYQHAKATTTDV